MSNQLDAISFNLKVLILCVGILILISLFSN